MNFTFVCVLKSGGSYYPKHVIDLAENIKNFHPNARVLCLSDVSIHSNLVEVVPLKHDLKGWFSKLEIFDLVHELSTPLLYLDLDVLVTRPIDLELGAGLHLLKGFSDGAVNSSMMLINGNYSHILDTFLSSKDKYTAEYSTHEKWGDQDFIRDHAVITSLIQSSHPNLVGSYKRDLNYQMGFIKTPPAVLIFHGRPKMDDLFILHSARMGLFMFSFKYLPKLIWRRIRAWH